MPRLESHASEGMMMAVGMAGSAGERAVVRPLKRFGTRREQKRLRCEAKATRAKSLIARKARPQYNHEWASGLLNAAPPQPSFSLAVSFQARDFTAPMTALRRCGLHTHDEDSSSWQRPSPGERRHEYTHDN
jgi:hypothetical protein